MREAFCLRNWKKSINLMKNKRNKYEEKLIRDDKQKVGSLKRQGRQTSSRMDEEKKKQ